MNKILCIYHANCVDGLGAAWAVHKALGDNVEFVAAKYGDEPPECYDESSFGSGPPLGLNCLALQGRDVLIVDFSYPLEVLRAMAREARSVLVLDHHKTTQEDLEQIQSVHPFDYHKWRMNSAAPTQPNLAAVFDLNRSGAGLAWDYLHPTAVHQHPDRGPVVTPVRNIRPRIIDLIEDRDLWKFKFGDESKAFHAMLTSYDIADLPGMFKRLDDINSWQKVGCTKYQAWPSLLVEGSAILRARRQLVETTIRATRRTMRIAGHTVPVANVPASLASDAGEVLCQPKFDVDYEPVVQTQRDGIPIVIPSFSATYYDGADGKRHFSLRSPQGGADVSEIARKYGGGGHKHAAEFSTVLLNRETWSHI